MCVKVDQWLGFDTDSLSVHWIYWPSDLPPLSPLTELSDKHLTKEPKDNEATPPPDLTPPPTPPHNDKPQEVLTLILHISKASCLLKNS